MAGTLNSFTYDALPYRVVFGAGTIGRLHEEVEHLGIKRAMIITTPQQRDVGTQLGERLGNRLAGVFSEARMHTPVAVTEAAMQVLESRDVDGLVAIGGGSTVGLSKALSLRTSLPQVIVPTTYAGSEMTPILGETIRGIKTTTRAREILPDVVIYDVDLTLDLPPPLSATSGLNAMAHAVEALYAADGNPVVSMMAESGIAALARALPRIAEAPRDRSARTDALYGAWLCGTCLGAVGMSLHHKLCHVLGGSFDLPHAETHAIILPHAAAYNATVAADAMARISRALDVPSAPMGLFRLARRLNVPSSLASLGMPESGIERAADIAVQNPYANPREIRRDLVRDLIARAYRGQPPMEAET
jgi:alcohol dehydrogenase class IV